MKFFLSTFLGVFFASSFSTEVAANGVCYDPNHTSSKNDLTVQTDMKIIASAGFTSVRTYISKFGTTELGPIIASAGLKAVLGVPYPSNGYQEQMEAAIKAANAGGVSIIMVGNENLAGLSSVPRDMIDVINQIKARVSVKVGTVQRNTEVIGWQGISGWSDLVAACDVLGANVQPLFAPGVTAESAIDIVDKQWKTMASQFGDKLILTETGWPSSGSVSGNICSLSGEQTFYNAYQQWSSGMSEKFYFQFFDTPGKAETHEQTFGLYTADMQPKFPISQQQSTTPSQQQPSAPMLNSATPALPPTPSTPPALRTPPTSTPMPATAPPTLDRPAASIPVPETNSGPSETKTTFSSLLGSDDVVQQDSDEAIPMDSDEVVQQDSNEAVQMESDLHSDPGHTKKVSSSFKSTESPKKQDSDEVVQQDSDEAIPMDSNEAVQMESDLFSDPVHANEVSSSFKSFESPRKHSSCLKRSKSKHVSETPFVSEQEKPFESEQEKPFDSKHVFETSTKPFESEQEKPYESEQEKPYESKQEKPYDSEQDEPFDSEHAKASESEQEKPVESEQEKPFDSEHVFETSTKPFESEKEKPYESEQEKPFELEQEKTSELKQDEPFESEHVSETPTKPFESEHAVETTQSTDTTNSIGKSEKLQQEQPTSKNVNDDAQEIKTQSGTSNTGGVVGLAVGGAVCAVLLAFGFIYHAHKRAQKLEDEANKDDRISTITPVEDICSL